MNICIYKDSVFEKYKSKSQITRVLTEEWFLEEMYCPCCLKEQLVKNPNNTPVVDFICNYCCNSFQLKSQKSVFGSKVVDGAFEPIMAAVKQKTLPSFSFIHYSDIDWDIRNLIVVPKFFFSESIIEKRKPLRANARRAGWVGCNIILNRSPEYGKIKVIDNKVPISRKEVQKNWKKLSFMEEEKSDKRDWISDVLLCIERLDKQEFSLMDLYKYQEYLSKLHPRNFHVKDKIRQQLQLLRNRGIIRFKSRGHYKKL